MFDIGLVLANLTSPAVLCFVIGAFAALVKSDLRVPPQVLETISMYLLFAIGLKGGIALSAAHAGDLAAPLAATLALGCATPVAAFFLARAAGKLDAVNAGAIAAHFGSVSAVTFMAALNFAGQSGVAYEGFLTALLVVLEIPGIVIAIALASWFIPGRGATIGKVVHEAVTGKSVILLAGGLFVGLFGAKGGIEAVTGVFITPFQGVLAFFLLEMGVVAAMKLKEVKSSFRFMALFGTLVPVFFGCLGALAGYIAGLSEGGIAVLATMAASASYIAAPAAVRMALPEANPGLYLTMAISITLPFNIIIGIPLYFALAELIAR
jgi:uncharacterized protein